MSTMSWSSLPVLPLKCVLDHLSVKDALAATATCRNWRQALVVYEGHRETLTLNTRDVERTMFLTGIFKRHAKRLIIKLDYCGEEQHYLLQLLMTKFYDTSLLYEIVFIGPTYLNLKGCSSTIEISRSLLENVVYAHRNTLQNLALVGVDVSSLEEEEKDKCNSRSVSFIKMTEPSLTSKLHIRTLEFTSLQYIVLDYDMLDSPGLESLCTLPHLTDMSLNLSNKKGVQYEELNWPPMDQCRNSPLQVTVNIISMPLERFSEIIYNVLVAGMPLVALRVLFCKVLHDPLLKHVAILFSSTLKELHWADSANTECYYNPTDEWMVDDTHLCVINPFILICWRCSQLQSLIIHGYKVSIYDLLGMARIRQSSLRRLDVSRLKAKKDMNSEQYAYEMNKYQFLWRPHRKAALHPALLPHSKGRHHSQYIIQYVSKPYGVT